MTKLPLKVCQQIAAGLDCLAYEYRSGRLLYKEILKIREEVYRGIREMDFDVDPESVLECFDYEFEYQFRSSYET